MALLEFDGEECPHCIKMKPSIEQLEQELGVEVQKFETWHNPENEEKRKKFDADGDCGGVPYFVNEESGKNICGEASYEELKAWAEGK